MNCEEILVLMNEKLDGCITPEDELTMNEHLRRSESSRALFEKLKQADEGLRAGQIEPPSQLRSGVMKAIRQEKSGRTSRKTWGIVAAVAAVAALFAILAGIGVVQMPGMQNGQQANTLSMGEAVGMVLRPDLPSTEGLVAPLAPQTATECGCVVAVFWRCEALPELEGNEYETPDAATRIYRLSMQEYETLMQTYRTVYPIGLYYPEGECSDREAIVMLLK